MQTGGATVKGDFSEFTLAEVLQLFALAEKSGVVSVSAGERSACVYLKAGRVSGLGHAGFDVRHVLLACELLPVGSVQALEMVQSTVEEPGLGFIVRNLVEPHRWESFTQRLVEQDIFPLLTTDAGEFEVTIESGATPPVALSMSVQQLILDGSRWEAEVGELAQDGYRLNGAWRRCQVQPELGPVELGQGEWLTWAALHVPGTIREIGRRLCMPDLQAADAVKRLETLQLIERAN